MAAGDARETGAAQQTREFVQLWQSGTLDQNLPPFAFDTARAEPRTPGLAMERRSVRTRDEQGTRRSASRPAGLEFRMPRVRSARVPSFRQCAFRPACVEADPEYRSTGILPSSPRCSCQDA